MQVRSIVSELLQPGSDFPVTFNFLFDFVYNSSLIFFISENYQKQNHQKQNKPKPFWHLLTIFNRLFLVPPAWMSQKMSKRLVSVGYTPNIPHL